MAPDSRPPASRPSKFVLLVGVPAALVEPCLVAASPYPVMQAETLAAALVKLGALRPAVVIEGPEATSEDVEVLRRSALAVGATVLDVTDETARSLSDRLRAALADADA